MKEAIIQNIDNPKALENLYRSNKTLFKQEFNRLYPDLKESPAKEFWQERLNFEKTNHYKGNKTQLIYVVIASIVAGFIAKWPDFVKLDMDNFYIRNWAFILFPFLSGFFLVKKKIDTKHLIFLLMILATSVVYINLLPNPFQSDSSLLACIHLPLLLWTAFGSAYLGNALMNKGERISFLRYNGDLVVMSAILLLAGALFSLLTLGLFSLININISEIYFRYMAVWGLCSIPLAGTYLIQYNPELVNKISPLIAQIFTPLVFITLFIYLTAIVVQQKDPYNDREFLVFFNGLLIGVLALIFFSLTEATKSEMSRFTLLMLTGLSALTIIINLIALSAIFFRLFEWGITPNRVAVAGGNLLIFVHLVLVSKQLLQGFREKGTPDMVEQRIAGYLPLYGIWAAFVMFLFPLLFSFK